MNGILPFRRFRRPVILLGLLVLATVQPGYPRATTTLHLYGPEVKPNGLRLFTFGVEGFSPPQAGDELSVVIGLQNTSDKDIQFGRYGIFVGCRDPRGQDCDFGHAHHDLLLKPGGTLVIRAMTRVYQTGHWILFPAYHLASVPGQYGGWGSFSLEGRAVVYVNAPPDFRILNYHGIRPTDPDGRKGLRNPERGFRIETIILGPDDDWPWPDGAGPKRDWGDYPYLEGVPRHMSGKYPEGVPATAWLDDVDHYADDGLTMVQAYCYLHQFYNGPIAQTALDRLKGRLDLMREHGLKAIPIFAYKSGDWSETSQASADQIVKHLEQLRPLLHEYAGVIHALPAGFVGDYGEWDPDENLDTPVEIIPENEDIDRILEKILEVLPWQRMTMVRRPELKSWTLDVPLWGPPWLYPGSAHRGSAVARVGFLNAAFLGDENEFGTWGRDKDWNLLPGEPGTPTFDYVTRESPYYMVDGEMVWMDGASDWRDPSPVDGLKAAERMRLHHYTTFSIIHSFFDGQPVDKKLPEKNKDYKCCSIDRWKEEPIDLQKLRDLKMPISDGYFQDSSGNPVSRTKFEYIRDHLGYRLELRHANLPAAASVNGDLVFNLWLINRGFSTLHNPRFAVFALISEAGKIVRWGIADADPRTWQPYRPGDGRYRPLLHRIHAQIPLAGLAPGRYRVGLSLPDVWPNLLHDPRYAIRVANRDVPWWSDGQYGVNILGEVIVYD